MKIQTAQLNYLRIAPRKVRSVADMIKGLSVNEAEAQLLMQPRRSSEPLLKLLRSAISNSKQKEMKKDKLFIKEIRVNQGPVFKRFMPRAQGRAAMIQKKTSHIVLILGESEKIKGLRFNIVKPAKIKKSEAAKIMKTKSEHIGYNEKSSKTDKSKILEEKKDLKPVKEEPGIVRKIFRRKSV